MEKIVPSSLVLELVSFKTVIFMLIVQCILSVYKKRNIFRFARKQRGPFYPTFQQIGLVLQKDAFAILSNLNNLYGFPCNLWIGLKYVYFTIEPSEVNTILTSPHTHEKASFYDDVLLELFQDSVFSQTYSNWKKSRKFINRHFSQSLFKHFVPIIYRYSCEFGKDVIKDFPLNTFTGLARHIMQLNFKTFAENILGVNACDVTVKAEECLYSFHHEILKRKIGRIFPYGMWKKYSITGKKFDKSVKDFFDVLTQIVELYKKSNVDKNEYSDTSKSAGLIGAFLNDKEELFTEVEIRHNLFFATVAAMDTTANTLAYTFILLGMHKDIQEKIYQEVLNIVGLERDILKEDLPNLKLTEMTLLETLRLFPVVPMVGRKTTEDLNLGTKILPKGCDILLPVYLIHRNEKHWSNSDKFIPDRFRRENLESLGPGTYLPFLIGPRDCLGKTYALTFMKVFLANVIRRYKFSSKYTSVQELSNLQSYMSLVPTIELDNEIVPRN